jgi:hypothetical protein
MDYNYSKNKLEQDNLKILRYELDEWKKRQQKGKEESELKKMVKKYSPTEILDELDMVDIQNYIRAKKLKKINGKIS